MICGDSVCVVTQMAADVNGGGGGGVNKKNK